MNYIFNEDILIPLGIFAGIVLIVWIKAKLNTRIREMANTERMALIEKGVYDFPMEEVRTGVNLARYLLWGLFLGLLLTGLGIGFIILTAAANNPDFIIPGLILLFPGLGMILFYKIVSKREKEEETATPPEQITG
ncbi:DUF6249 domain-containing protein [candidate division KSB1 bacterium]